MKTIKRTVLKEGYFEDGLTVKIIETRYGSFKVCYYIHCEDRHSEIGEYKTYTEALEEYENVCVTYC